MAQIEDVTGPSTGPGQHFLGSSSHGITVGEEHHGVEVALHRTVVAGQIPAAFEIDPPVDPDHAPPRLGQERQQFRIAGGEVDHWRSGGRGGDRLAGMGQDVATIVVGAKAADPTVEELDHLGSGVELGQEIAAHAPRDPCQ